MAKYELVRLERSTVFCTNNDVLEAFLEDLRKELPLHKLKATDASRPSHNKQFEVSFYVSEKPALEWWIIKWFLDRGWEPFSHYNYGYDLRRKIGK